MIPLEVCTSFWQKDKLITHTFWTITIIILGPVSNFGDQSLSFFFVMPKFVLYMESLYNINWPSIWQKKRACYILNAYLLIFPYGTIHLRCQHVLGGQECPHVPMVQRSQYIRIKNPLHKHFAGMPMVGE